MKVLKITLVFLSVLLSSCHSKPSLQKYFVDHQEQPGFAVLDISPTLLNIDNTKISPEQSKALASFHKMNILTYRFDKQHPNQIDVERKNVAEILKDTIAYQQLMKIGSGKNGASISYVGEADKVDEFVLYGVKSDLGLVVVRILGDKMNPADALTLLSVLKYSKIDMKQLEPLKGFVK
ncbi:DUF4252 domain-containing protein [Flavobacterium aciduliphilum]|uniref:Uncharacterized protein DUF4252 n=1 Tax=Flavobacterium aciduliphilum TaxID=1101402 RepID=A0A328Z088_9FLAO|nr:DUF4252 domain-containing protein [Flavobacterium aciduliphilum]RAR75706.1 uncharacterized protein DUF4252 [Flavobacterium aciduliphilum]